MQTYFFLIVHFALVFQEFKYAELAYHFCFETMFQRNKELIDSLRGKFVNFWKENCSSIWTYTKKNIVSIFHMLSRFLPASVQTFTEPFFQGIFKSYEDAYAKSKAMESTSEMSDTGLGKSMESIADVD